MDTSKSDRKKLRAYEPEFSRVGRNYDAQKRWSLINKGTFVLASVILAVYFLQAGLTMLGF